MRFFLSLLAAAAMSLTAYLLLFGLVVSRPLVVGQIGMLMQKKLAYAQATSHPKLFVVAGSNARFSHSCATLEVELGRPCINMGISADVSPDWILDKTRGELAAGDMVYLPIEYVLYSRTRIQMETGMDAAYRFRHDKASLTARGPEGAVRAAFMFSLPTLIHSVGEMTLRAMGVSRRFNSSTLDRQGDEMGHDGAKALAYVGFVRFLPLDMPEVGTLLEPPDGSRAAIAAFLDWCHAHGVVAVGGLPTVFDDHPISDAIIDTLKDFYAQHGAAFIVLSNRSQYPRADFYDSASHLRQSAQIAHSRLVAQGLRPFLPRSP